MRTLNNVPHSLGLLIIWSLLYSLFLQKEYLCVGEKKTTSSNAWVIFFYLGYLKSLIWWVKGGEELKGNGGGG